MKDFFKDLFAYSHHYNQQVAEMITANPNQTSDKALQLFNHTLNAHHIWNSRINYLAPSHTVWGTNNTDGLAAMDKSNYLATLLIIDTVEFSKIIEYKTSAGQPFRNSVRDILFHVVNHSTYHRGQIATEFKNKGIDPITSDYIFYKR